MRGRREKELADYSLRTSRLGEAIRAWRRFRGLSVTELAVQAGFGKNGRGYISRIEHSQIRHLAEERLNQIALVLQVPTADLLLHRMPAGQEVIPTRDLDHALVGGKALLGECVEQTFDWARVQLLLAGLYQELATTAYTPVAKYAALLEAQQCIESAFPIFTTIRALKSLQEATLLGQEISEKLESLILSGSLAFLKRCLPQSLDWARIQQRIAKFYYTRSTLLQGQAALAALTEAQQRIQVALSIFASKEAQRNFKEAHLFSITEKGANN